MAMNKCEPHDPQGIRRKCIDRFWSRVDDADGDANQCWHFQGSVANHGYPNYWYMSDTQLDSEGRPRKRYITAHRFSALIDSTMGVKINDADACVMHHCDNKTCVNPYHLTVGTQLENIRDMMSKGRYNLSVVLGENNGNAKLTEDIVRQCRQRYAAGGVTYTQLAKEFGVFSETMRRSVIGETWSHIK